MSDYPNEEEEFEMMYGDELELMNEMGKELITNNNAKINLFIVRFR